VHWLGILSTIRGLLRRVEEIAEGIGSWQALSLHGPEDVELFCDEGEVFVAGGEGGAEN